jgi:threonine synthase
LGWSKLYEAGLINRLPRMVAVQSAQVSPLYLAWRDGFDVVQAITPTGRTIADGVNISNPVRGKRLLHVVSESRGRVMAIQDHAISEGQRKLAKLGFYVEPTSALVCAALKELIAEIHEDDLVLLPLTGNGLKGEPTFNRV